MPRKVYMYEMHEKQFINEWKCGTNIFVSWIKNSKYLYKWLEWTHEKLNFDD